MPGWCAAGRGRARARATRSATGSALPGRRGWPSIWAISPANCCAGHAARFIDDPRAARLPRRRGCHGRGDAARARAASARLCRPRVRCSKRSMRDRGWAAAIRALGARSAGRAGLRPRSVALRRDRRAANDLIYVSPRSGQAVSEAAGAPYRDQLLRLPRFLLPGDGPPPIAGRRARRPRPHRLFLDRRVLAPHGRKTAGCAHPIR